MGTNGEEKPAALYSPFLVRLAFKGPRETNHRKLPTLLLRSNTTASAVGSIGNSGLLPVAEDNWVDPRYQR